MTSKVKIIAVNICHICGIALKEVSIEFNCSLEKVLSKMDTEDELTGKITFLNIENKTIRENIYVKVRNDFIYKDLLIKENLSKKHISFWSTSKFAIGGGAGVLISDIPYKYKEE